MYKALCLEKKWPLAKQHIYETIFNIEYIISFYQPKKNQCSFCELFTNFSEEEKVLRKLAFDLHQFEKSLSQTEIFGIIKISEQELIN